MGWTSRILTWRLPATVLHSSGECPCTSALGLWTRRNSAGNSNASPLSKTIVRAALSLRSLNSVGHAVLLSDRGAILVSFIAAVRDSRDRPLGLRASPPRLLA